MAQHIEPAKAEKFAEYMLDTLNKGMLALLISVGHQTGLYDTLAGQPPLTCQQVVEASGLHERYVREWLNAMVASRVVEYDPPHDTYYLPPEHAAVLTRAAGADNMAMLMQFVPLLGDVEQKVIQCFHAGGGVPYSEYPRFQRLQAEETTRLYDALLVGTILPLTGMVERLERGAKVLDVGCGAGHAINVMARAFPHSRFSGYDMSEEGIEIARQEAVAWRLPNARFEVRDVSMLEESEEFDLITAFDSIHDQKRPADVLRSVQRALRKDGVFLMQDIAASSNVEENIGHPQGPALYGFSLFHCMTVSLAYGGDGLGTVWGKQLALHMLREAGFNLAKLERIQGDALNYYYVTTKESSTTTG